MFSDIQVTNERKFLTFMEEQGVPGIFLSDILRLIEGTDFFTAPASTQYHGAYPGGLFDHCLAVAQLLVDWTKKGLIEWERSWSPAVVGMLHDFTKVDKYEPFYGNDDKVPTGYDYSVHSLSYGGHGSDSCIKILQEVNLSQEEILCIRYHMGAYERDDWNGFEQAIQRYQTVLWTHHADMVASKVMGV